ncbi:MAG: cobalamin B12-binding domain-containing protein [bacterium]
MSEERKYRIMIGKAGLDGHDRGAKVVARGLKDAGYEVIYTGIRQTPEDVASTAVQEDVDAVGLSSLSGGHMAVFPEVIDQLEELGRGDIPVFGGGVIPDDDAEELKEIGMEEIFGPGTDIEEILKFLDELLDEQ